MLIVQTIAQAQQGIIQGFVDLVVTVDTLQKIVTIMMAGTTPQKHNGLTWMFVERKSNYSKSIETIRAPQAAVHLLLHQQDGSTRAIQEINQTEPHVEAIRHLAQVIFVLV
jgi:hypothetical protein